MNIIIKKFWYWIPYVVALIILLIVPYNIEMFTRQFDSFAMAMLKIIFPAVLVIGVVGTIISYRSDSVVMLKKLSLIPWVVVASHVLLLYCGNIFSPEGGMFVLGGLVPFSLLLSLVLYVIGIIIKKYRRQAV